MNASHLEKQVEQIADEASGGRLSVIVQMQTSDNFEDYLRNYRGNRHAAHGYIRTSLETASQGRTEGRSTRHIHPSG